MEVPKLSKNQLKRNICSKWLKKVKWCFALIFLTFFYRLQVAVTSRSRIVFGCLSHIRSVNLTTWWVMTGTFWFSWRCCLNACPVSVPQVSALGRSAADAVFKFEPFVLHVQCRQLGDAQLMVGSTQVFCVHYKTNIGLYWYLNSCSSRYAMVSPLNNVNKPFC